LAFDLNNAVSAVNAGIAGNYQSLLTSHLVLKLLHPRKLLKDRIGRAAKPLALLTAY
jgi:hypothetical protein